MCCLLDPALNHTSVITKAFTYDVERFKKALDANAQTNCHSITVMVEAFLNGVFRKWITVLY